MIRALSSLMFSLALAVQAPSMASRSQTARPAGEGGGSIVVRGRVVCLDQNGRPAGCSDADHRFGFQSSDDKLYSFLPGDSLTGMFEDPAVRELTLQITGNPKGDNGLEIIKVLAVRGGKLHDIFYFCDVCNITAYAPGPCACCRKEMELKQTPVPEPE